jgi:hypothetical protein
MRFLDTIACVGFIAALIVLPFSFYYFRRAPIRSALFFAVPLLIFMGITSTSKSLAQARVLTTLELCSPENATVLVNGREVFDSAVVLSTLKEICDLPAHHSSPSRRFTVEIRGPTSLFLVLARDSGDPREYWVFYPAYMITRYNAIGRIRTSTFDAY